MSANGVTAESIDVEPLGVEFSDEALDLLAGLLVDHAISSEITTKKEKCSVKP